MTRALPPLLLLVGLGLCLPFVEVGEAAPAATAPTAAGTPRAGDYVRGVGLGLFASDPQWDYGPMLEEIRARGASDVLIVVNAYQSDRFAHDIRPWPGHSPSHPTVARTLGQARALGLRVALMPVVRLRSRRPGEWRGTIMPAAGADAWFAAYREFALPLLDAAADAGAVRFYVGSELSALEHHGDHWRALVAEARTRFGGKLSYSANWDRARDVDFWDALDEVALTAYFPMADTDGMPDREALARAWRGPQRAFAWLSQRHGLPVIVSEVGYASQRGAARAPWDDYRSDEVDLPLQVRLYEGFCDALPATPAVAGFYVWNWFGVGGPLDVGFSPRGKPAAAVLQDCFARAGAFGLARVGAVGREKRDG